MKGIVVLAILLVTQSCGAGWRRTGALDAIAPRQQVQVWQQGRALRWHAVRVDADTVRGIPFFQPLTCDSCRLAVPRNTVDSMRVGNPVAGFWKSVALVVGITVAAGIVYCWEGCYSN